MHSDPKRAFGVIMFGMVLIGYTIKYVQIEKLYAPVQQIFGFSKLNESMKTPKYVSVCEGTFNSRRTGNMIFVVAAILYVSKHTGRKPVMPQSFPYGWINHIFTNDFPRFPNSFIYNPNTSRVVHEKGGLTFDPIFKDLHANESLEDATTILICGYFQSCRYVEDVEKEMRDFLKFKEVIIQSVVAFIRSNTNSSANVSYIGLHVRRGDFASSHFTRGGFSVVDENYINISMNYVISSFDSSRTLVAFVCSDDINWVRNVINKLDFNVTHPNLKVVYSIGHDAGFDLCLLSKCNASIMSTGTYSWWSAWLANTSAVYYSLYPTPKSALDKTFISRDYFLPKWKGLP